MLKGIKVYALVGKAGTGKSFRARLIADRHGIEAIIDDGLVIHRGKIVAGRSAKHDEYYLTAIKTSLFNDLNHRNEVIAALNKAKFQKILLLGTSDRMIHRNCLTLGLPAPEEIFRIEDVATEAEIAAAREDRKVRGKHVIPLPIIEVKQAYPKLIARAIKVWLALHIHPGKNEAAYEKTVVRPAYHTIGEITISENALVQMILHCLREQEPDLSAERIRVRKGKEGYEVKINISLPYGKEAADTCHRLRGYIMDKIQNYAGIQISKLALNIDSIQPKA